MAGAFTALYVFRVNVVYIIMFCGTLGGIVSLRDKKTGKERI